MNSKFELLLDDTVEAYNDNEKSGKCYEAYVNLVLELEKLDD